MALVKYCAAVAAILSLAASAPTPQFSDGIQNDVVNVINTDNNVNFDEDYNGDGYYEPYRNVDPDPLHHVYYETGPDHKRDAAPQFSDGIQNDVINVIDTDPAVDVDDPDRDYWIAQDPDPKHHYYEDGPWHKRQLGNVINVVQPVTDVLYDNQDYNYDQFDWHRENDPDYLHHRYYLNDGDPEHHYFFNGNWY